MSLLHAREWGDPAGPPLVCLHGMTAHSGRFEGLAERLRDHRVVAFDLRAHGRSTWNAPWGLSAHVDDIIETCDALRIDSATWVGHSFGGRLVLEVAARHPERVSRHVLLDPVVRLDPVGATQRAVEAAMGVSFSSLDEAVDTKMSEGSLLQTPRAVVVADAEVHLQVGQDGRWRWRFLPQSLIVALSELATEPPALGLVPTLMVVGAQSWVPVPAARPGVQTVEVPGGHVVLWDAFEPTARAVETFLASPRPASSG